MVRTNRMCIGRPKAKIPRCAIRDKSFGSQQISFQIDKETIIFDIKLQTFDLQSLKQWIEHFCRRKPREVMYVLVDSTSNTLDYSCADMG